MKEVLRRRVERVFQEAADLPAEARGEFLDRACDGDRGLRESVERLLCALDTMGDFLERKAPDAET